MAQTLSQLVSDMQSLRARLADGTARNAAGEPASGDVDAAIYALDQSISALTGSANAETSVSTSADETIDEVLPVEPASPPYDIIQEAPGAPDDLRDIRGISSATAYALTNIGITRFAHIAGLTAQDVAQLRSDLGYRCTVHRDNWIEQAAILAKGQSTSFSRRGGPIGSPVVVPAPPPEIETDDVKTDVAALEDVPAALTSEPEVEIASEAEIETNAGIESEAGIQSDADIETDIAIDTEDEIQAEAGIESDIEIAEDIEITVDADTSSDIEIASGALLSGGAVAAIAAVLAKEDAEGKSAAETDVIEDELAASEDVESREYGIDDQDVATSEEIDHTPDIAEVQADASEFADNATSVDEDLSSEHAMAAAATAAPDPYAAGPFEEFIPAPEPTNEEMAAAELVLAADVVEDDLPIAVTAVTHEDATDDTLTDETLPIDEVDETDAPVAAEEAGEDEESVAAEETVEVDNSDMEDLAAAPLIDFDDEAVLEASDADDDTQDLPTNGAAMNGGFTAGLGALIAGSTVAATANENDNGDANDDNFDDRIDDVSTAVDDDDAVVDDAPPVSMTEQDSDDAEIEDEVFATLPEPVAVLPDLAPITSGLDPEPPTIPITARLEPVPDLAAQNDTETVQTPASHFPDPAPQQMAVAPAFTAENLPPREAEPAVAPPITGLGAMLAAESKPLLTDPEEEPAPSHQAFDLAPDAPPFAPIIQSREPVFERPAPEPSAVSIQISEPDAAPTVDEVPSMPDAIHAPIAETPPSPPPAVADRLSPRSATIDPLPEPFSPHKSAVDEAEIVIVRDGEAEAPPLNIPKLDERDTGSGLVGRLSRMFNRKS